MRDVSQVPSEYLIIKTQQAEQNREWTLEAEEYCLELFRRALGEENEVCWSAIYSIFLRRVKSWLSKSFGLPSNYAEMEYFRDTGTHRFYFALHGSKYYDKSFKSYKQILVFWRKTTINHAKDDYKKYPRDITFSDIVTHRLESLIAEEPQINEISAINLDTIEARIREILTSEEFKIARFYYMYRFRPRQIRDQLDLDETRDEETLRITLQRIKRKLRNDPKLIYCARAFDVIIKDEP